MIEVQPSDEAAREAIRSRLDATLFVEAGAGTGKTTELVRRVVNLVRAGGSMARIAAITFTEKAAAELRDRIRIELERAAAAGDDRCAAAVAEVDEAAIQTLHAFAQRILAAHPLDAGLPPGFEVVTETESSVSFSDRWSEQLDRMLADPALEPVVAPAFALGLTPAHLRLVAWELHRNWDRLHAPFGPDAVERRPVDAGPVLDALDNAVAALSSCADPDDKLYIHLDQQVRPYRDLLARMVATGDESEVLAVLADPRKLTCRFGKAPNWCGGVTKAEAADRCSAADDARARLVTRVKREVFPPLLERLRRFTLAGAERRRVDGRLEFHDLLVLARDLLRANGEVRLAVRGELDHLLIDEFQDTDPLQIEIAVALAAAGDGGGPLPPWGDVAVEPGRLFFVGDPKQSIYRFRRADILLYQQVQARFGRDAVVRLQQNFRSTEPVLAWVNHAFTGLMGDGTTAGQPVYMPLDATWPATATGPSVALVGGPTDAPDIHTVREAEAADVATVVARAKADGWLVADRDDGGQRVHRPAQYRDMAVLLPTRTSLPALERALEGAGVPYRVESRSLVWSTAEVRDLLGLLRAVDDPTDEVALLTALRSPALACGDDDLLAFVLAGGRWDHRHPGADSLPADHPVLAGMATLRGFWERRWWASVSAVVEEAVRELRLLELAFASRRQREAWHRLRFVVDQARAYVEAGGATLRGFLDWAEQQADERSAVIESVVPESDDDAVRVMTVHAAKGLEFPIVVLAGLHSAGAPGAGTQVVWDDDGTAHVRAGREGARFETAGFESVAATEDVLQALEDVRLLYVAATRARDHLVVGVHHNGPRCPAAEVWQQSQSAPHLAVYLEGLVPPDVTTADGLDLGAEPIGEATNEHSARLDGSRPSRTNDGVRRVTDPRNSLTPTPPPADLVAQWETERAALVERHARFPSMAATDVAKKVAGVAVDDEPEKDEPEAEAPPWQRGRAGTAFGRAVHAVLQTVDLRTGEGADGAAAAQAAAEGIPDRAADVARAVRNALRSPAAQEAAAGRSWREVYVAADLDGTVLEGFVDLLYEAPEGLVVVDWKTDAVRSAADLDAAVARYRAQAAAYAVALERTLQRPVVRCELVFTAGDGPQQRTVAHLAATKALVAEAVAAR
ncbi:MAG TPA: UvrD-helicase domain-containing protein [Acidimicrobiales bacterium]|nr:UvrD-helicase domain-containing protein [Acidimicrobiales bacterium]